MTEKWHHKWKTTVSRVLEDPENVSGGGSFPLPTESAAPLNLPRISGGRWDRQSRRRRHLLLSASPTVCLMQTIAPSLQRTENEEQSLWTSHLLSPQNYNVVSWAVFWIFRKLISDISKILPNMFRWHFLWNCLLFPSDICKPSRTF